MKVAIEITEQKYSFPIFMSISFETRSVSKLRNISRQHFLTTLLYCQEDLVPTKNQYSNMPVKYRSPTKPSQ